MAQRAMYAQQQSSHGTLMPGQTIYVNQYTVQVERYLSQGGYAHVYLVRTPTPVFGTTRHVLKRIAVANEALLSEVKKEVDIMRILKGHPNIVYFIDAAWNMLPNGTFEVFILMEFCAGGGIIDMMNRRLRERLTEAEILQVFVDVCEAVAAMHNLRPPLLHRDLKVENILQSSDTSYKLCDFGSAAPVSRPPTNSQEHHLLEADLNRHTTLQYRAPEMVDLYLRRPIDEKSDVWALGVLLYKLCYYTTPFEEHGVLAILNVQYKIPPYPVYSTQMNELIGSMLKELGAQRLSVFEILDRVHKMRGTKSKFTYIQPSRQAFTPRVTVPAVNPLDGVISYRPSSMPVPVANNGTQAREKVHEANTPSRREKPRTASPAILLLKGLPDDTIISPSKTENNAWQSLKPARAHKSGVVPSVAVDVWKSTNTPTTVVDNNPWSVRPTSRSAQIPKDLLSSQAGFGDSFNDLLSASPAAFDKPSSGRSSSSPSNDLKARTTPSNLARQDAFESLNVFPIKGTAPTLGEQKSGLTTQNKTFQSDNKYTNTPSPRPSTSTSWNTQTTSSPITNISAPTTYDRIANDSFSAAEQRFPSLEELDAGYFPSFPSTVSAPSRVSPSINTPALEAPPVQDPAAPRLPPRPRASEAQVEKPSQIRPTRSSFTGGSKLSSTSAVTSLAPPINAVRPDGVRSQHVTGTAMREAKEQARKASSAIPSVKPDETVDTFRKQSTPGDEHNSGATTSTAYENSPLPQDWLTGDDSMTAEVLTSTVAPILRASPEKRSSTILQQSSVVPIVPVWEQIETSTPSKSGVTKSETSRLPTHSSSATSASKERAGHIQTNSTTASRAAQRGRKSISSSSESADTEEGPEEAISSVRSPPRRDTTSTLDITPKAQRVNTNINSDSRNGIPGDSNDLRRSHTQVRAPARKKRQSSVHDLVDLWGGGINNNNAVAPTVLSESSSDSANVESGRRKSVLMSSRIPGPKSVETQEISGLPSTYTTGPTLISSPNAPSTHRQASSIKSLNSNSSSTNTKATTSNVTTPSMDTTSKFSAPKKPRPQSMFATPPIQKAFSDNPNATTKLISPEVAKSKSSFGQSLAPPPPLNEEDEEGSKAAGVENRDSDRRPSRSPRRSSISNIVSRYEAIGAGTSATSDTEVPRVATKPVPAKINVTGRSVNVNNKPELSSPTKASASNRSSSPIKSSSSSIKGKSTAVSNNTEFRTRTGIGRASTLTVPSVGNVAIDESRSRPPSVTKSVPPVGNQWNESFGMAPTYGKSQPTAVREAGSTIATKPTVSASTNPNSALPKVMHKPRQSYGGVRAHASVPPLKTITPPRDEAPNSAKAPNITSFSNTDSRKSVSTATAISTSLQSHDEASSPAFRSNQMHTPPVAPTPERPYQGVSRLIDQWQKKSEEAEGNVVLGRGRGVKGRREGLISAEGGTGGVFK